MYICFIRVGLFRILVDLGVAVNHVADSGGTALMFAAGGGHNETTVFLLENNADVHVVVQATEAFVERVADLIAAGNEDVEPHKNGITALSVAAQGGHLGTVQLLVEAGAAVDFLDDEDMSPLITALKGFHPEVAMYLLQHGANPNDVLIDDKGENHNLLIDAVVNSNVSFALLLIEKGANISVVDKDEVTVITQAAFQGFQSIVEALLEKGADPSVVNVEGINALIAAASEGHKDIVQLLLDTKKVDINACDKDGTNALMAAAVRGHKDIVTLLLVSGAEVNAQNNDGHTALMFAYNGKNQVETLLAKYKKFLLKDPQQESSMAIIREALDTHIEVVNSLIRHKADPMLKVRFVGAVIVISFLICVCYHVYCWFSVLCRTKRGTLQLISTTWPRWTRPQRPTVRGKGLICQGWASYK
jgi:uncharacterized protein